MQSLTKLDVVVWTIIAIVLFVALWWRNRMSSPIWLGRSGEKFVSRKLSNLDSKYYKILDDLVLPSQGNTSTTQIDHVVVSNFGIFCIETKNYTGWIFGNAHQQHWTQVIYR